LTIKINLNIDRLPSTKSSKSQFWPLLGPIVHDDYREKPSLEYSMETVNQANLMK